MSLIDGPGRSGISGIHSFRWYSYTTLSEPITKASLPYREWRVAPSVRSALSRNQGFCLRGAGLDAAFERLWMTAYHSLIRLWEVGQLSILT